MSTSSQGGARGLSILLIIAVGGIAIYLAWTLRAYTEPPRVQESPGVVTHPTGLERCLLAVVGKDQQSSALGVLHHVLCENVHIGDWHRLHRASRLAIPSVPDTPALTA